MMKPYRAWINQPSVLQPCHRWHGTNVIAYDEPSGNVTVYFLSGPVVSMLCSVGCLSKGWLDPDNGGNP